MIDLEQPKRKSKTDQLYDNMLEFLLKGNFRPGDQIPAEDEIKDMFGVSRNTVRTVLQRLNMLGIVETQRGRGTFLKNIGSDVLINFTVPHGLVNASDALGILEFRRGIETAAARLAAINATQEDIDNMERYFNNLQSGEISGHDFATMTSNFHQQIAIASKNDIFVRLLEIINWIIVSKMEDFLYYKSNVADSGFYHYLIFKCIQNHKPDEAAYLMDRHMYFLIERFQSYIEMNKNQTEHHSSPNSKNVTNIF